MRRVFGGGRRRWIWLALLAWAEVCAGQDLRYLSHQAWGTEEGLPQSSVHAIVQTTEGYLWVATEGGLARFDGTSFRTYGRATDKAFDSDDICCLKAEADGSLLVGTASGWLLERNGSFKRVSNGTASKTDADASSVLRNVKAKEEIGLGRVQAAMVDRAGLRWVGMRNGLAVVGEGKSAKVQRVAALEGDSVLCLFEDAEGNHWVGTETSGLHVLRRVRFRSEPGLTGLAVTSVVEASDGAMWVGTRDDGVRRVKAGVVMEPVVAGELTSGVVLSLAPGEAGGVWIGTPDGLNFVTAAGRLRKITSSDGLPDDYVRALAKGSDGEVWVGTAHGLALLRGGKVVKIFTAREGLKGDDVGVLIFGPSGGLNALKELWVASTGGIAVISKEQVSNDLPVAWLNDGAVSALSLDRAEGLWAATERGRLGRLSGGLLEGIALDNGGAKILGMATEGGKSLWLRMDHGVWRVGLPDLETCLTKGGCSSNEIAVSRYGRADGLPNDEAVDGIASGIWLATNGELWFPTRRGVGVVDTGHLEVDRVAPPVVVERVLVDDVVVPNEGEIKVPYGQQRLTLEYAGLSFRAPSEVRYRVQLQGFDKGWLDAGTKRSATYTNLGAGNYTFRVRAMNGDGIWSLPDAEVSVRVVPPYWRRWWFLALILLATAFVLAGIYLLRLRRLRRDFEVMLAERNRMAREIHDTLTQDFVGTSLQLDIVAHMLRKGKVEAALEQVVKTRRLVTDGLDEARRSIWALRANNAEDGLPVRLRRLVEREEWAGLGAKVRVGGAYRKLDSNVDRELLRVAQEALQNVKRHAGATETLIELHYSDEAVLLTIEDNGVGFEMAAVPSGHYGLMGMRERAEVVDGTLKVASGVGVGTKISLRIAV